MRLQKNLIVVLLAVTQVAFAGCTTIAFFPTAPAQKAADKVIDDIWPAAPVRPATAVTSPTTQAKDGVKEMVKVDAEKTEARK